MVAVLGSVAAATAAAIAMTAALLLGGCSATPVDPATAAPPAPVDGEAPLRPWRTVSGGFVAPAGGAFGMPAQPFASPLAGPFVKLVAPTALALQGNDLLIVDSGAGRIWRADLALQTLAPIAGVPATPATRVALGPDLSAWVLDGIARQVHRFARDGRRLQSFTAGPVAASAAAFALVDGGSTLLVADDSLRQWLELRPVGAFAVSVRPGIDDGGLRSLDGIASQGDRVALLDRSAGVVHLARRDGLLIGRLGEGLLKQPVTLAFDRWGRIYVHDAQDRTIKRFAPDSPMRTFTDWQLGVQLIGAFALDERLLAVADRLTGDVVIHLIDPPEAR